MTSSSIIGGLLRVDVTAKALIVKNDVPSTSLIDNRYYTCSGDVGIHVLESSIVFKFMTAIKTISRWWGSTLLRTALRLGHNVTAAPHCVAGIGVPIVQGGQAASNAAIFMFVSKVSQFWAALRGVLALAVSLNTVRQPASAVLLNWRCGGRFNQTVQGVIP